MSTIANDFIDFIYCGHSLSEYDGIIGEIGSGGDISPVNIGSELNLNPVEIKPLKVRKSVVPTYDSYVEKQFSFFKNVCSGADHYTWEEVTQIMRWLNQQSYEKFTPVYSDPACPTVHYYASFNVQPIPYNGFVIGFQLNMVTNAPFGYYDDVTVSDVDTLVINDISDEKGFIYPICNITANSDGHLILTNNRDPNAKTIIANCKEGETITLNGKTQSISTSAPHVNFHNDFNYIFPKIWNDMSPAGVDERINIFSINDEGATISMTYTPISKFGLIF